MNEANKLLGTALKKGREAANLSQTELASLIGISQPALHKLEKGLSGASWGVLYLMLTIRPIRAAFIDMVVNKMPARKVRIVLESD
jgi:transcriptional regulator with XRE-family HTH domain